MFFCIKLQCPKVLLVTSIYHQRYTTFLISILSLINLFNIFILFL